MYYGKNIHMTKNKNTSQKKKSLPKATWGTKQQQQTIMAEHTKKQDRTQSHRSIHSHRPTDRVQVRTRRNFKRVFIIFLL